MAMRRSRKLAWFWRARLGVRPRGILNGRAAAAVFSGVAVFGAEDSGADIDTSWRDEIWAGRHMSFMLEVAKTETFGCSRRIGWGNSGMGEVSNTSVPRVDVHSQEYS